MKIHTRRFEWVGMGCDLIIGEVNAEPFVVETAPHVDSASLPHPGVPAWVSGAEAQPALGSALNLFSPRDQWKESASLLVGGDGGECGGSRVDI